MMRVLLADDHLLFRKGMVSLMVGRQDVEVVGEADDGFEAVAKARELRPDLIIMDVHMPKCTGIEATRIIKSEMPEIRIVMLTVSNEDKDLREALELGAQGYLLKNLRPETLFEMLRSLEDGGVPLSPTVAAKLLQSMDRLSMVRSEDSHSSGLSGLTARETEIVQMVAAGTSNRDIATRLFIAEGTVKNHLHNILEKLGMQNRAQLASFATREGLTENPNVR